MKKLAIVVSHPIQYYAPVFKLLQERQKISIRVFYTWGEAALKKFDPGFYKHIEWDIPLLDGYAFEWVKNTAADPGSHHFKGIVNPGLVGQINQWAPTAVLVFGWAYDSHLKALRYYKGRLPVYFRGDSTLLDQKKGLRSLARSFFLKWVYRHVDHAFHVGMNNKAYFKKYGLKDNQLSFAPHAVDNVRFATDRCAEVGSLKKSLGITPDDTVILFAGKLEDKKDPFLLLSTFLRLNRPGTHLILAGSGPLENELKRLANGNKTVHFMDFQNQDYMPVIYQACDLFCLPSKGPGETWGLAVNEAMACKKAVLVSDKVGCAADLVKKDNGRIVAGESPDDLLTTLEYLTGSKMRLKKFGEQSFRLIEAYNFLAIARTIEHQVMNDKHYITGDHS